MSDSGLPLERARALHRERRWSEACDDYGAADAVHRLDADDLESWAESAQLSDRITEAITTLERSIPLRAESGDLHAMGRSTYWLWQALVLSRAEYSRGAGWVQRASRLGEDNGWLLVPQAYGCIVQGDWDAAVVLLSRAAEQGTRHDDVDLTTIATVMIGRAQTRSGRLAEGLARLDEAMLTITGGLTSPRATAAMYCACIGTCHEAWELSRANEWSVALGSWLDDLPRLGGMYFGNCRIYRAMLLRQRGDWSRALVELEQACADLEVDGQLVVGHAWYELGEMYRLLGRPGAIDAYRRATAFGHGVQPGLALHHLRRGELDVARSGLRRALAETSQALDRLPLLAAYVTTMENAEDAADIRKAVDELEEIAQTYATTAVHAELATARGALALAVDQPAEALGHLRAAAQAWRQLRAPYETAVAGVRVASGCRRLGDDEGARFELDAARDTFARLGAEPDRIAAERLLAPSPSGGLSSRELQVLRLLAAGLTNAQIAAELHLSERTVHRHVSSIFTKLAVHSRTAAAAYAVQHDLT